MSTYSDEDMKSMLRSWRPVDSNLPDSEPSVEAGSSCAPAWFGAESEHRRAESLSKTVGWLIENVDRIHAALCPGQNGIWQERVRQAVAAAEKAPIESSSALGDQRGSDVR